MTEHAIETRRRPSRSHEVSLEGLRELLNDTDPAISGAAAEALRCVDQAGADPRLMLLVIEAAVEGQFDRSPGMMGDNHWTKATGRAATRPASLTGPSPDASQATKGTDRSACPP